MRFGFCDTTRTLDLPLVFSGLKKALLGKQNRDIRQDLPNQESPPPNPSPCLSSLLPLLGHGAAQPEDALPKNELLPQDQDHPQDKLASREALLRLQRHDGRAHSEASEEVTVHVAGRSEDFILRARHRHR